MSDVTIYHPGLGTESVVPEEAVPHWRRSGWLLRSEHDANQAAAAGQATAGEQATATEVQAEDMTEPEQSEDF